MWWRKGIKIRTEEALLVAMREIADTHFPNEAGGALMGYMNDDALGVVITHVIGPGPEATHNRASFIPDYPYQETEIGRLYNESQRTLVYLGDWHSHPNGPASLSGTDRRALMNIANFPEARINSPIMILLSGRTGKWNTHAWQLINNKLREASILL